MEKLKLLDLFSGIGGMSLGLEATGHIDTAAFCEIDNDCRQVLNHYWPNVPKAMDVKNLWSDGSKLYYTDHEGNDSVIADKIDMIAGGFPCQDISKAKAKKTRTGVKGERSGLWKEYARLIGEIRPEYVIIENVEYLRKNGLAVVLNDLAHLGYDAEWGVWTGTSVGLPHQRERLYIVSYPNNLGQPQPYHREGSQVQADQERTDKGLQEVRPQRQPQPGNLRKVFFRGAVENVLNSFPDRGAAVRSVRRVTDGIPTGLSEEFRQKCIAQLGNAVIPQIPQAIGMLILKHMGRI